MSNVFFILCLGTIAGQFVDIELKPGARDLANRLAAQAIAQLPTVWTWVNAQLNRPTATERINAAFEQAHRALEAGEELPAGFVLGEPVVADLVEQTIADDAETERPKGFMHPTEGWQTSGVPKFASSTAKIAVQRGKADQAIALGPQTQG